jgi:hypothetical protein
MVCWSNHIGLQHCPLIRAPELALSSWNVDGDVSALHTRYDVRLSPTRWHLDSD